MPKVSTKSYALRIEAPLVKPLQALKKQHRRSLNAEINAALAAWVAASREPAPQPDATPAEPAVATPEENNVTPPVARKQSRRKTQPAATPEPADEPQA
jgi:hypothetical protein